MKNERLKILEMVSEGKLSVDDAAELISTITRQDLDTTNRNDVEPNLAETKPQIDKTTVQVSTTDPTTTYFKPTVWMRLKQFIWPFGTDYK